MGWHEGEEQGDIPDAKNSQDAGMPDDVAK